MDKQPSDKATNPANLLRLLKYKEVKSRLEGVRRVVDEQVSDDAILAKLEQLATHDGSAKVRQAAMKALADDVQLPVRRAQTRHLAPYTRKHFLAEIEKWAEQKLISPEQAEVLTQRYGFDLGDRPPAAKAASEPKPRRSLTELLLSETSITVALYLGAFFIIAAAFILAAAFEDLRFFILFSLTILFGAGAILSRKRLPKASFTLTIIVSFLILVDAQIALDALQLSGPDTQLYWGILAAGLSALWAICTRAYRSRLFALTAVIALVAAGFFLAQWLMQTHLIPFLYVNQSLSARSLAFSSFFVGLFILGGLAWLMRLKSQESPKFVLLAFLFLCLAELWVLGQSLVGFALQAGHVSAVGWWCTSAWLLGAAFFLISDRTFNFIPFAYLASIALASTVGFVNWGLHFSGNTANIVAWSWASVMALGGDELRRLERVPWARLGLPLIAVSVPLYMVVINLSLIQGFEQGFYMLLAVALVWGILQWRQPRHLVWLAALLALFGAYLTAIRLGYFGRLPIYPGYIMLWPGLLLLAAELVGRRRLKAPRQWLVPTLFFGLFLAAASVVYMVGTWHADTLRAAIGMLVFALFSLAYALVERRPRLGYLFTAGFALAFVFFINHYHLGNRILWMNFLYLIYYGLPLAVVGRHRAGPWPKLFTYSGLALAAMVASWAFSQGGTSAIITMTIAASLFALEAYLTKQVWFAVPANLLYLGAYFSTLGYLHIDEPQYYSIGAALLGMIMHYLLRNSGAKRGAAIVGTLSQLVLFSTTYIQLISTGKFSFFSILFFQALVVIVYGLVIRGRSFVTTPIIFLVLAVLTMVFNTLYETLSLLVIGCSGLLLLGLGIAALLLRERIAQASENLGERLGGWQD